MRPNWMSRMARFIAMAIVGASVLTVLVMVLWNWLAPSLFHLPVITIWQSFGLLVLSKILFGGFRGGPGGPARDHWRHRMMERMEKMSPDEQEAFRRGLGKGPPWRDQE